MSWVHVLGSTKCVWNLAVSRRGHATTAKKLVKNRDASTKLLFYKSNPITFFPFLLPSRRHLYLIPVLSLQAAIGSVSLDMARERGFTGMLQEELGIQVITVYNPLLVTLFVLVHVQWCQKGFKILMMACSLPFGPVHVVQLVKRLSKVEAVVFFSLSFSGTISGF